MTAQPNCPNCGSELNFAWEENCEVEFYDCNGCKKSFVVDIEIVRDWDTLKESQEETRS